MHPALLLAAGGRVEVSECRCKGCLPWHFELRGWRQIIAFDALLLLNFGLFYWLGVLHGRG